MRLLILKVKKFNFNKKNYLISNQHRLITALNDYREECLAVSGSDRRKQIFTLAIHSLRHWNGRICGVHSKLSRQLMTSASCANAAANGYRRCWNGFTDLLKNSKNQETEVQKATLCCAYYRTLECMREVGMGVRPELTCSETSVDLHQQYVQLLMGGSVEVVCAAYDEVTDRCDRLVWKPYKKAAGRKEAKKLWKKKRIFNNEKFMVNFHQSSSSGEIVQLKPFFNLMLDTLSARA